MRFIDLFALRNDGENSIRPSLRKVVAWAMVISTLLAVCILIFFEQSKSYALLTVTAVVGAFYVTGSGLGFIFAVPKSFQGNAAPVVNDDGKPVNKASFRDNTSLEEISDWLTKIIIGITLIQFNHLQAMVREAAVFISRALQTATTSPTTDPLKFLPFSYALIIFYSAIGMICGYLWTRVEFPKILKQRDDDLSRDKVVAKELLKRVNNPEDTQVAIDGITQTQSSIDPVQIEWMDAILRSKPSGTDPDDTQKGRWGGKPVLNNRILSAEVGTSSIPGLYKVKIKVSSIDKTPLPGPVGILLHKTFEPVLRVLNPAGQAEVFVEVIAYEAFAVGALTDVASEKEYNQLELDLNDLPNLPEGFYWK